MRKIQPRENWIVVTPKRSPVFNPLVLFAIAFCLAGPVACLTSPPAAAQEDRDDEFYDEGYGDEEGLAGELGPAASVFTSDGLDLLGRSAAAAILPDLKDSQLGRLLDPEAKFEIQVGPQLRSDARQMFASGRTALATALSHVHMAAEYDQAAATLASVRFSPRLKRPAWQLRLAVSMAIRGDQDIADPSPIGGGGGFQNDDQFDSDFGTDLDSGNEGISQPRAPTTTVLGGDNAGDRSGGQSIPMPAMLSDQVDRRLREYLGTVADHFAQQLDKRFMAGNFGNLHTQTDSADGVQQDSGATSGPSVTAGPAVDGNGQWWPKFLSPSAARLLRRGPSENKMWRPGIEFLGEGPSSEMLKVAKSKQIDYLLHFDVTLKQVGRQNQTYVQNVCRARLVDVPHGKSLVVSKAIDNTEILRLQRAGRTPDPQAYIADQTVGLWRTLDRETHLVPMPSLGRENADRRIGQLIARSGPGDLRALSEIRVYQSQGLIDEADVAKAFSIIGGPDALVLMYGPLQQRLDLARDWAVRAVEAPSRK